MGLDIYLKEDVCEHCGRAGGREDVYITYNHGGWFHVMVAEGILPDGDTERTKGRMLGFIDGRRASDVAEHVRRAIARMPDVPPDPDAWAQTVGNARAALIRLLEACERMPNATISTWR